MRVTLFSEPVVLGTTTADQNGLASLTFVLPATTPPGAHTIEMLGLASGKRFSVALQVSPSTHDDHLDHDDGGGRDDHRGRGCRI